ncbi:MAG TPA: radical SAM protein [Lentisphaeria bacterium]|nr:MAG: radical SAM protein [Lentisphaerae bacterium GWF2_38_69]HBM16637.1 radical SAM protein [Lentisphaeria bacterium]
MLDRFNRKISYLRISVTDRCNLRCNYCMCGNEFNFIKSDKILSFEEIYELTAKAVEYGIDKVRITGGEPLVRKNIVHLIKLLASIKGIKDFSMTTNGIMLFEFAEKLKEAGLHRINVSLDTIDPDKYREITRGGELKKVLEGLEAAKKAGLSPIKINCVIRESPDEIDAKKVAVFCHEKGFNIRYIRQMNIKEGKFWPVIGGEGGKCSSCSRLRLSSDGKIYPCLFSDKVFSIRELGIEKALKEAIRSKPKEGDRAGNEFYTLGG